MATLIQDDLLQRHLHALLGTLEPAALALLQRRLEWVTLAGGQVLMQQGEPGDSMYLVISGRLRAWVRGADGQVQVVREMARGEVVGEMSLYTGQPRTASVVAVRDAVLVRLGKAAFEALLARSARVSMLLTRQLIERLHRPEPGAGATRPAALALLPISAGVDLPALAARLAAELARQVPGSDGAPARVCVVDADALEAALQAPGLARQTPAPATDQRIARHLDALEATHEFVLLLADDHPSAWTLRCTRRCDEVLLLADADAPPVLHPSERECLLPRGGHGDVHQTLVLLHPADRRCPQATRAWLDRRPLGGHLHLRPALPRDLARGARVIGGQALGLVFSGGGARGLAHLGVLRALQARGIEVDVVGGTSIGAVMATLAAVDRPLDEVVAVARHAFAQRPTGDLRWLPLLSLVAGRRLQRIVQAALQQLTGAPEAAPPDLEDLWLPTFVVASNHSRAREQRLTRGPLARALLASIAIPGVLPPVLHQGDLLCDGGTFNNFPVDVMRAWRGVGRVVGVDLGQHDLAPLALDELPGTWALLRDRLRAPARRRYRLPSLVAYLMKTTVLYSASRLPQARALADLVLNPPLAQVGMLQWEAFDRIVALGQAHAEAVLDGLDPPTLQRLRPATAGSPGSPGCAK